MQNKLIIFDIDGTLTNTNDIDSQLFEKAILDVFQISPIDTQWSNYKYSTDTGIVSEIIQSQLMREPLSDEIESIKNCFVNYLKSAFSENKSYCLPINGSQTIFNTISLLGWDIGIATGGWKNSAILKLQTAEITHQSIPIASSDDHMMRENIISIAIERAKSYYNKLAYSKTIYVGDRMWDKKAAQNLQIDFIGIGNSIEINDSDMHIADYTDPQLGRYLQQIVES